MIQWSMGNNRGFVLDDNKTLLVIYTLDKSPQPNNSRNRNRKYYMATSSVIV